MHTCPGSTDKEEGGKTPRNVFADNWQLLRSQWELNLGPQEAHQMFLTTPPSHRPQFS